MERSRHGFPRAAGWPLLLAPLVLAACGDAGAVGHDSTRAGEEPAARSAVLVTFDTTRADAITCYGGHPGITPHVDALAAEGIRFERAYTVAPMTLPAHASILTGLTPPRHGLRVNGASRLPESATTLAEAARSGGLTTAAFVSSVVLDPAFGLDQGFQTYDAPKQVLVQKGSHYADRPAAETVAAAARWIAARADDERFFLWVHLWDAHGPWDPPPELRALAPDDDTGYLGEVASDDRAFGSLMDALRHAGRLDDTLVALVADHGEAFWEHGEYSHGALTFDPTVHVPLILRLPGGERGGTRVSRVVSVVDLFPTLVAALDLTSVPGLDGEGLLAGDDGGADPPGAYLESYYGYLVYGWAPLVGWVDARGKFLFGGKPRLFDPARDPAEEHDLAGERPDELAHYEDAIERLAARPALPREAARAGAGVSEGIAALGYAAAPQGEGEIPAPLARVDRPDPIDSVGEHARMLDALGLFNQGDYAGAEGAYRAILAKNPDNVEAMERLGIALIRQRRFGEAVAPLARAQSLPGASAAGAVNLGTCYRALGNLDLARQTFEHALELDASQVRAVRHLVDLSLQAGDRAKAEEYAARFTELTGQPLELPPP